MTQAILSIKHWGNNLGVRLPQAVARAAGLHAVQQVRVSVEAGRVVMEPVPSDVLTLEERPKRFDPKRHGGGVLSPRSFKVRTSLVIGLPMTTADFNSDNPLAVLAGTAAGAKAGKTRYVLCHQPKSFDWRARGGRIHPMKHLDDVAFAKVCGVLHQIIGLA